MKEHIDRLQSRLGHVFAEPSLLTQALTHRSFGQPNNERLEFLGDSILDCVISLVLFERFGDLREGELSRVRASLVC
ncbi:MAG: ribonuclease III, partial [Azoarcus sp.]|nr:ribonuclease III [Azoarcus sp.]